MKKRGISPLIGTVLLIGFTIALAMLVFTWGGNFFRDITQDTESQATDQLICVNDLNLVLFDCDGQVGGEIKYTIENKKGSTLESYILRVYGDKVVPFEVTKQTNEPLVAFGIETRTHQHTDISNPTRIELLNPKINKDGRVITCPDYTKETTCN